jgi:hypothetical protein
MTYGLAYFVDQRCNRGGEAVSHMPELVRGNFTCAAKTPSSALRAPSPQGEKGH